MSTCNLSVCCSLVYLLLSCLYVAFFSVPCFLVYTLLSCLQVAFFVSLKLSCLHVASLSTRCFLVSQQMLFVCMLLSCLHVASLSTRCFLVSQQMLFVCMLLSCLYVAFKVCMKLTERRGRRENTTANTGMPRCQMQCTKFTEERERQESARAILTTAGKFSATIGALLYVSASIERHSKFTKEMHLPLRVKLSEQIRP